MGIAAALALLLWSPARAGEPAAGCLGKVAAALNAGDAAPAAACFEPDAAWLDEEGAAEGREAVRAGLERLGRRSEPGAPLRWVRLSTGTWMLTGVGRSISWRHLVVDLSGRGSAFEAARVYRGARAWGAEDAKAAGAPRPMADIVSAFNGLFGAGDTEAFIARWAPDAVFVSAIGPFEGPEVAGFFRMQALRYEAPHFTGLREHGPDSGHGLVFEGFLEASCLSGGTPFRLPFLMRLRWYCDRIGTVYEAFASLDDGCGMFWTAPR
ncbi:MAG: nuclear transport factor 2 family protein [Elusimicrobia bacterium]|nr:nuclear transport factor 2 family protein [Elusimicrobiota bacterium]